MTRAGIASVYRSILVTKYTHILNNTCFISVYSCFKQTNNRHLFIAAAPPQPAWLKSPQSLGLRHHYH